jgi:hypothetical protein
MITLAISEGIERLKFVEGQGPLCQLQDLLAAHLIKLRSIKGHASRKFFDTCQRGPATLFMFRNSELRMAGYLYVSVHSDLS